MAYYYKSNLDQFNRVDQLEIQLDDGATAILEKGHYYDLTVNEVSRARQYIELISSAVPASDEPISVTRMMIKGSPLEGEAPFWRTQEGAFVPGDPSIGGVDIGPLTSDVNQLKLAGTVGRVNLCSNPRGIGSQGWYPTSLVTFNSTSSLPSTTGLPAGVTTGFHATGNASGDRAAILFPVTNGVTYRVSVYVYADSLTGGASIATQVLRGLGGTQVYLGTGTTTQDAWVRLDRSFVANETNNWEFRVRQLNAGTTDFYWTAVLFEESASLGTFFDGNMTGFAWVGLKNASSSEGLTDLPSGRLMGISDRLASGLAKSVRNNTSPSPVNTEKVYVSDTGWNPGTSPVEGLTSSETAQITIGGYYNDAGGGGIFYRWGLLAYLVNPGTAPLSAVAARARGFNCSVLGGSGRCYGVSGTVHGVESSAGADLSTATVTVTPGDPVLRDVVITNEGSRFESPMPLFGTGIPVGATVSSFTGSEGAPTTITMSAPATGLGGTLVAIEASPVTPETLGYLATGTSGAVSRPGTGNPSGTAFAAQAYNPESAWKQGVNIQTGALQTRGFAGGIGGTAFRAFALSANRAFASEANDLNDGFVCDGTSTYINAAFRVGPSVSGPDGMIIDGTYTDAALLIRANAPVKLGTAVGTGNYLEYWEQTTDPAAAAANALRVFSKDLSGKTMLARRDTGATELIPGWLQGSKTFDWPSVADNAMTSTTVTVTGAVVGNLVVVGHSVAVPAGALLVGAVTAADTVTVTLLNRTGGALDLASGTLRAAVAKFT